MEAMTRKQENILRFIEEYLHNYSLSPTFNEIRNHFGFGSINAVQGHIAALIRKGHLKGIVDKKGRRKQLIPVRETVPSGKVPLLGTIAAGQPIDAIEETLEMLDLSSFGIDNHAGEYFALTVRGDSMIDAHIVSGDVVVIRRQQQVTEHEVAAVLLENEATLKYVKRTVAGILLIPANKHAAPIIVDPHSTISILGKVVRVIRSVN